MFNNFIFNRPFKKILVPNSSDPILVPNPSDPVLVPNPSNFRVYDLNVEDVIIWVDDDDHKITS